MAVGEKKFLLRNERGAVVSEAVAAAGTLDAAVVAALETYADDGDTATLAAVAASYQPISARAAVNGYASLDADGKVPTAQLPTIFHYPRGTAFPSSPAPADGDVFQRTDLNTVFTFDGTRWLSQPFPLTLGSQRASGATNFYFEMCSKSTQDTMSPILATRKLRIISLGWALLGSVGGKTWTTRLRKNGSGSDLFTSAIVSSIGAWVTISDVAVGLTLSANDRLNVFCDVGVTEAYNTTLTLVCAWEGP